MKIFGLKCSKSSISIWNNVMNNCPSSFDSSSGQCNRNGDDRDIHISNNNNRVQNKQKSCDFNYAFSSPDLRTSTPVTAATSATITTDSSVVRPELAVMREKKSGGGGGGGTLARVQKFKKRLSHSFGRLSISKENHDVIYPYNGYSDEFLDRLQTVGNLPDSKSDVQYNHTNNNWKDRVHRQLSVSSDSKLLDDDIREENKVVMRPKKPPRPKSEVFLSQHSNDNRRKRYSAFGGDSPYGKSENYIKFEPLGEGSYATVFKGYSTLTNQIIALKEIRLLEEEGAPFTAIREASILKELKHANIVTLHDIVHTKETLTFVFEYLQTDLSHYLERTRGGLDHRNVKLFLFQLLRGLAFCHKHRVLHRDVKPQNLLISEIGELKLADFGLARTKSVPSHTYSHEVVTLWYRPPDVLLGSTEYSTSLDMWGVGCIFVEMIQGVAIFTGMRDVYSQLDKIFMRLGTPTEKTWPGVTSLPNYKKWKIRIYPPLKVTTNWPCLFQVAHSDTLAASLLELQPSNRINAEDALRHPYFSNLPKKLLELPHDVSIFTVEGIHVYPEKSVYKKLT